MLVFGPTLLDLASHLSVGIGVLAAMFAVRAFGHGIGRLQWPTRLEDNNHATETIRFTETKESKYTSGLTEEEIQWGWPTFIAHTKLDYNPTKNCQYLKYNRLHFKIVTVELIASHR